MSKEQICGNCKWHEPESKKGEPCDWVCVNSDSEYLADFTEFEDTCDMWEER